MILPASQDRGIVVFLLLPSLPYGTRLAISFALIVLGILVQVLSGSFLTGCVLLLPGNLLLLVKGYDNRVDAKGFDPETRWERVDPGKLEQLKILDEKIKKWDSSALDVTNGLGLVLFLFVFGGLGFAVVRTTGFPRILALDAIVLLLPHWITGIRSILRRPSLLIRIEIIQTVLARAERRLTNHNVTLLMLLSGGETPIPEDVKFRIDPAGRDEDFLGLYGQVVINEVQGTSYPYFYVVLVARKRFGLHEAYRRHVPLGFITKEFKREGEVEVMVLRQTTTKRKGYATDALSAERILLDGLGVAEQIAAGVPA